MKEFDIYATMDPAREVGGDFYDFILVDDNHLAMVMADVSGKGVPAALFMMVTRILISERVRLGGSPAEVLEYVNTRICEHNKADMFICPVENYDEALKYKNELGLKLEIYGVSSFDDALDLLTK